MEKLIEIAHAGTVYSDLARARASGVPAETIGAACKQDARRQIAIFADRYRARLASTSAGKLAEYRFKEEIARSPATASQAKPSRA